MVEKKQIILFSSFLCSRNNKLQVSLLFTPSSIVYLFSFFFLLTVVCGVFWGFF